MHRILHLGPGNFHRAHQAAYTWHANRGSPDPWRIVGVAMRSTRLRDEMAASGWAYDLGILGADGVSAERIGVHDEILHAPGDPERLRQICRDPRVAAITLTVTEKGYGLGPDGRLDPTDPAIAADRAGGPPRSAVGIIARTLLDRAAAGHPPLTILSCDNLAGNGRRLEAAVQDFLAACGHAPDLADAAVFPDTMVDRITPATTPEIAARIARALDRPADAPVLTEAFSEWIIEDRRAGPLPDWHRAGARFVPDVAPFERRKLLLLNGAHSALAYAGLLRGHRFVHEAIADPVLLSLVRDLWSEAAGLLPAFGAAELGGYREALIARFSVSGMEHRLAQIAMDGTLKLPQRLLPVLRHHGYANPAGAAVLGAWWRLVLSRVAAGRPLDDPAEAALRRAADVAGPAGFRAALPSLGLHPGGVPEDFPGRCLEASRNL